MAAAGLTSAAFAQATLPTSNTFASGFTATNDTPLGWSYNLLLGTGTNLTYATGSDASPACRLDNTGEYIQIFFADAPGALTYYIKGTGISPNPAFAGQFDIQESVDGNAWTAVHTFSNTDITGSFVSFTDVINSASRYVRFFYTTKVSGSNISLDQISLAQAAAGATEIQVSQGTTNISSGGDFIMGCTTTSLTTTFNIANTGTSADLNLSNYTFSGTDASMFSVSNAPTAVPAGQVAALAVVFTPTGADGTKTATLTFATNDTDEDPTVINLTAYKSCLATEPANQATALVVDASKTYTMSMTFAAAASNPDGYIVLRKTGAAVTEVPVDGTTYERGDQIGAAQVISVGNNLTAFARNIVPNTTYHYAVFAYNGASTYENYNTTAPLTGSGTTAANMIGNYYASIDPTASTFLADLTTLINPHTQIFYANYASTIIADYEGRDTVNGQRVVTCVYSGLNKIYSGTFDWTTNDFSREHTYCYSWMQDYGTTQNDVQYSDLFNLFPVKFTDVNSARSNYPLGEVVTPQVSFLQCSLGNDAAGDLVFEPRAVHKGDAARAMMYMLTCYNGVNNFTWALRAGQSQGLLKTWNTQDPPNNYEMGRNDYIKEERQNNRNPYIDHPEWANQIDFVQMVLLATQDLASVVSLNIAPNPTTDLVTLNMNLEQSMDLTLELYNAEGQLVKSDVFSASAGTIARQLDLTGLASGAYYVRLTNGTLAMAQTISKI